MPTEEIPPEDPLDSDDELPHDDEKRGFVPDFVRRMAWAGLGAVFMSEEGIRRLAKQLKLPKEAMGFLLQQAEKTKDEIGRVVGDEVRKLMGVLIANRRLNQFPAVAAAFFSVVANDAM